MNILIHGDSWGVGEWNGDFSNKIHRLGNYGPSHPGLAFYIAEYNGDTVRNISEGNYSNQSMLDDLYQIDLTIYDKIIWFQADPIRDLRPYSDFKERFKSFSHLMQYKEQNLDETYCKLNNLNKEILCIGGSSKLDTNIIKKYNNLKPTIPSVIELLIPGYEHPKLWFGDYISWIDRQFDIDSLDKIVYHKKLLDGLVNYPEYFSPDREHPNRLGHYKIFEIVVDYLK